MIDADAMVLVDHGSRRTDANELLDDVARALQARLGERPKVYASHMELAAPSLGDAITQAIDEGARSVVIAAFFLAPGRHMHGDIPAMIEASRLAHPAVEISLSEALGGHPALLNALIDRAIAALSGS